MLARCDTWDEWDEAQQDTMIAAIPKLSAELATTIDGKLTDAAILLELPFLAPPPTTKRTKPKDEGHPSRQRSLLFLDPCFARWSAAEAAKKEAVAQAKVQATLDKEQAKQVKQVKKDKAAEKKAQEREEVKEFRQDKKTTAARQKLKYSSH